MVLSNSVFSKPDKFRPRLYILNIFTIFIKNFNTAFHLNECLNV